MKQIKDGYHITKSHLGKTLKTIKIIDGKVWLVGKEDLGWWYQDHWFEANDYHSPCNCGHCKLFGEEKCDYLKTHNQEILKGTCPDFKTKVKGDY